MHLAQINVIMKKRRERMGFTINDALVQTQDLYKLKLLAGEKGCSNSISWVHMIEDTTIIRQLWGKELAVTTGLGFQTHDSLKRFIKCLVKYHSVGLIINTGKYIFEIQQDIIDYCNEHNFPLLTTPWEVHMADLIKDFSMRCLSSEKEDRQISKCFIDVFSNPRLIEDVRMNLMSHFDVDGYFQVLLVSIENANLIDTIERRRIAFQLELYFGKINCAYSFFWFDGYFVCIVNDWSEEALEKAVERMYISSKKRMSEYTVHLGIGTRMQDMRNVILSYKRALAAVRMATTFQYPMMYFEEMGVYAMLFLVEDRQALVQMHDQLLSPLIKYDETHHSDLERTLYYYLIYDGHQKIMAEALYMHRNTVNYRLMKIKELIGCDLESFEEKMPYMLAFYIKKMIKNDDLKIS